MALQLFGDNNVELLMKLGDAQILDENYEAGKKQFMSKS
jgi:hypothetical protein